MFDTRMDMVERKLKDFSDYNTLTRNMVNTVENFAEKYQPLFNHRQIHEALEYVFTGNNKFKMRLKKFTDNKQNYLIDKIVNDEGVPNLESKKQILTKSIKSGFPTSEEVEAAAIMRGNMQGAYSAQRKNTQNSQIEPGVERSDDEMSNANDYSEN